MIARMHVAGRQREILLTGVLLALIVFALARNSANVAGVDEGVGTRQSISADLMTTDRLQRHANEINRELINRKALWRQAESSMFEEGVPPVVIAAVSQELVDLARAADLQAGQPNITIDSTSSIRHVNAHLTVQGTPDAIVTFLDTLSHYPVRLSIRALQLTRTKGTSATPLAWVGSIDITLLLRGANP